MGRQTDRQTIWIVDGQRGRNPSPSHVYIRIHSGPKEVEQGKDPRKELRRKSTLTQSSAVLLQPTPEPTVSFGVSAEAREGASTKSDVEFHRALETRLVVGVLPAAQHATGAMRE
eukprot:GHVU01202907.1.p2 GENE.GHVU01202907.1~~GHVU01202907.1.p2  ORF type:complete len:115 (+),score=12.97 GHVU01202907.1:474-818(+)